MSSSQREVRVELFSLLPEVLVRKILLHACFLNYGKKRVVPYPDHSKRYWGCKTRFERTSEYRPVNKLFARLLPKGEFAGLHDKSAVFFASDTLQFAFAIANYWYEFGHRLPLDMMDTHVFLYDRVFEFHYRINPVHSVMGKEQSQILLDVLRVQWPLLARSHPAEVQRDAVHVLKKWYSYLASKRQLVLSNVLKII